MNWTAEHSPEHDSDPGMRENLGDNWYAAAQWLHDTLETWARNEDHARWVGPASGPSAAALAGQDPMRVELTAAQDVSLLGQVRAMWETFPPVLNHDVEYQVVGRTETRMFWLRGYER